MERFTNPFVDHQVTSIMLNAFPKFATRDLPGLKEYLRRKGTLPSGIVLRPGSLITYYKGGRREDAIREARPIPVPVVGGKALPETFIRRAEHGAELFELPIPSVLCNLSRFHRCGKILGA